MFNAAYQVIERFALPEYSFGTENLIDTKRREVHPRITLRFHGFWSRKYGKQMYVIRHDDEVTQAITITVKMQECVSDKLGQFGSNASPSIKVTKAV